jgi:ribosomal protein S18 acetylase RimI-like enzyme
VPGPRTRAFGVDDVAAASRLLAGRHAAHRGAEPLLAQRFEDPEQAATEIRALLEDGATGAVAVQDGRVVGYVLGRSLPGEPWGSNVWVPSAGQAVTAAETVRDLYAEAATSWVQRGLDAHYVLVPAHDRPLVDAWFRLGFGQQHAHAVREVLDAVPPPRDGLVVRPAVRADVPALAALDLELPRHQGLAPTFSAGAVGSLAEALADWEESVDDEGFHHLVAEHGGVVVGAATACALERSSLHDAMTRPDRAGFLGFAAVSPEARGLGAGRALGEAVLGWAAAEGYRCAATDWRVTNLLSSRTWPRLGFRPTFLRLHRQLGH